MTKPHLSTITVRSGLNEDTQFGCVAPSIYPSSTYSFAGFEQPRAHDYSRRGNPTRDHSQRALADLEGGAGAILTSSGMSAIHLATTALLRADDVVVAPHDCYGGTQRLLNTMTERGHYRALLVDMNDADVWQQALQQKPKLVFIETPSNPLMRIYDIQRLAAEAHAVGALVIADNTFMTPVLQQPLQLGADVVVHSCTKYLNGHSDIVAGALIAKDPQLAIELGWWGNNIGVTTSAFDSYLLLRGLRTLDVRMQRHQENAQALAAFLQEQPSVSQVYYPGLTCHPGYALAQQQQRGFGAMLSFELHQDIAHFVNKLTLFTLAESLGGVESLIAHPATMTHAAMTPVALRTAGISNQLLRISVGIEHIDDLIADLQQGFAL